MRLWKHFILILLLLSCATALPDKPNRPEFCYQRAQVDGDKYSGPKNKRLREMLVERSRSLVMDLVSRECQADIAGFLAHPDEAARLPSLCQYFRLQDHERLRDALFAQVEIACYTRAEDLCPSQGASIEVASRACAERNMLRVLEALALGETSVGDIE